MFLKVHSKVGSAQFNKESQLCTDLKIKSALHCLTKKVGSALFNKESRLCTVLISKSALHNFKK